MADKFIVTFAKVPSGNGGRHVYVETEEGTKVAAVWGPNDKRVKRANLFAASPELLQIAKDYLGLIQSDYETRGGGFGGMQPYYDTAKAIIERAEADE